jgi:hypothetical protein
MTNGVKTGAGPDAAGSCDALFFLHETKTKNTARQTNKTDKTFFTTTSQGRDSY